MTSSIAGIRLNIGYSASIALPATESEERCDYPMTQFVASYRRHYLLCALHLLAGQ